MTLIVFITLKILFRSAVKKVTSRRIPLTFKRL